MIKKIASQIVLLLVGLLPMTSFAQQDDLPDLVISNFEVTDRKGSSIIYTYQITNVGNVSADINGVLF